MASSEDHQKPNIARRGLRGAITKLLDKIQEENGRGDGGSNVRKRVFLDKLIEYRKKAIRLDFQIMEKITTGEGAETEKIDADERMLEMEETIADLRARLGDEGLALEDTKADGKQVQSYTKLPKLEIKPFKGDPLEFASFRDQFQAAIGRSELAEVAKFGYLKGLLQGEALRCIQGLQMTDKNYKAAWDLLVKRYGKKNLVVNSIMKHITDLKTCGDNDTKSL